MQEYTELEDKYEALVHRVTNSSRFEASSGPSDAREQYEYYVHLRSQTDRHIVEQYRNANPFPMHQDENSDRPRDRCNSCSYCDFQLEFINAAKANRIFRKIFNFEEKYNDLFRGVCKFPK